MNIFKLEPGDIIVHELFGDLTILERDVDNDRYFVCVEKVKKTAWIDFWEVEEFCQIKK